MSGATGYVVVLNEARAEVFDNQKSIGPYFAEAVPEFEHSRTTALVCFIEAEPGVITHLAKGKRGQRAGTGQRRLNLEDIREIRKPIAVERISAKVGKAVRRHIDRRLTEGGLLPPKSFGEFVAAVLALSPELRDILGRYSSDRQELIDRLSQGQQRALGAQKEALSGALHIAQIDRGSLLDWSPPEDAKPRSFMDGMPEARLMEDHMIWHDHLEPLPGFEQVKKSISGVAKFENEFVELEVIVANRTSLEQQTGADLIYFNATFNSFILVQYKAMDRAGGRTSAIFRLPNTQLADELERMDALLASIKGAAAPSHRHGYRLNENPFFLKLCPRIVFDPDSIGLSKGMYIPLDYWRFLEKDPDLLGKRGGRFVSYDNVGRYLDNSHFAAIVRGAWIGTTPAQTAMLAPLIEALLREGRAVLVAVKSDKPKRSSPEEDDEELNEATADDDL